MASKVDNVQKIPRKVPLSVPKSQWEDPQALGIIVAIIAVLITLVLIYVFLRKRVKRQGILLLGLSDSGKTLIFARLAYEKFFDTHTSMKENEIEYKAGNKSVQLIDVPGQERVRNRILDHYKSQARGLVFVIDSLTVQRELRDVAEYLYNILSDDSVQSIKPPILILCNKQDESMAKGSSAVRSLLEKELNILRKTKTSQLDSIDNQSRGVFLGMQGKDFEFDHLSPLDVTFAESSAIMSEEDNGPDLQQLEDWIQRVA